MKKTQEVTNKKIYFLGKPAIYDGEYFEKGDYPEGYGNAIFKDGDSFTGYFVKGKPSQGIYTFSNGSFVQIEYVYDKKTCDETHKEIYRNYGFRNADEVYTQSYKNGRYTGEFNGIGLRDGIGTYEFVSGNMYSGGWKNGKRYGVGVMDYKNGNFEWGVYINGYLVIAFGKDTQNIPKENTFIDENPSDFNKTYDSENYDSDGPFQIQYNILRKYGPHKNLLEAIENITNPQSYYKLT